MENPVHVYYLPAVGAAISWFYKEVLPALNSDSDFQSAFLFNSPVEQVVTDFFHSFTGNHLSVRLPYCVTLPLTEKLCASRVMIVIQSSVHAFITTVLWVSKTGNTFNYALLTTLLNIHLKVLFSFSIWFL